MKILLGAIPFNYIIILFDNDVTVSPRAAYTVKSPFLIVLASTVL